MFSIVFKMLRGVMSGWMNSPEYIWKYLDKWLDRQGYAKAKEILDLLRKK